MPIYEYQCRGCAKIFEEITPAACAAAPECPGCGSKKTQRCISATAACAKRSHAAGGQASMPMPPSSGCGGGGFS
ncbi:MAG: zinc ribbon domain-containing protein [Desulfovibrionaceae bacterium]|nr:zinc ribbon domain-containing protein [Desulfovibrionaceae bacterium]MBF0512843.1 zinc ribbon domain-containing protein [Desulfovibrionaceae bacterium]